ncbi:MAG: DinB superfamily protein [Gemmataceae bacterium]|nr:DinB superfamily protein [Gemmataceae bacterium]
MTDQLLPAIAQAFGTELDAALGRIVHCAGQLTDEQVWWRPRADMNSIGNLILHLTGNVNQFFASGVGGAPDDRDRPGEFAARDPRPKSELVRGVTEAVDRAKAVLAGASADDLWRVRRVNNTDLTGLQAVVRSTAHFRGHTQEIIHLTRTLLGGAYRYAGPR